MDVGLDPELTKWSVRSGPAIALTGKGYKEHHWLVIPFINHFSYLLLPLLTQCLPLLALSPVPKISMAGAAPPFVSMVRPAIIQTPGGPLLRLCLTRKDIA